MVDQGEASRHGSCRWDGVLATAGHRARTLFCHWGQDNRQLSVRTKSVLGSRNLIGMGGGSLSVVPPVSGARKNGRGMRPAGGDRWSPPKVKDGRAQ